MSLEDIETRFEDQQLELVRQKGVLRPAETIEGVVSAWKYSMVIFAFGFIARLMQKRYLLLVTNQRVLLIHVPAFTVHGGGYYGFAEASRPCPLKLADAPQSVHQNGIALSLPDAFAQFVGRPAVRVVRGLAAQKVVEVAGQNP